jgi:hypothetical protein
MMEKEPKPFTALLIEDVDFDRLEGGVRFYADRIKMRLRFINGYQDREIGLIEVENIIFQLRCITETYSDYVIFLFQCTTAEGISAGIKSEYAADKRLKKLFSEGKYALISADSFQNPTRLQEAKLINETGALTYLDYSYFRGVFSKCGNFLHEDKPMNSQVRDFSQMCNFASEHTLEMKAWFWQHWIACEGFNIIVNFGENYESETSISFLDVRD